MDKNEVFMKLGASNKYFYYTSAEQNTFSINFELNLREEINEEAMRAAADEALACYPELAAETVIKDGRLCCVRNDKGAAFLSHPDTPVALGSGMTKGHLFYFGVDGNVLSLSFYHGLSDFRGMFIYLIHVLYIYAKKTGHGLNDEEEGYIKKVIRSDVSVFENGDQDDLLTPYEKYGNINAEPAFKYESPAAFVIPQSTGAKPGNSPKMHGWGLKCRTSDFLNKTKEYGVSAVPYLVELVAGSIRKTFDAGDSPVVSMVPVDMRPLFSSQTLLNFSDGALIPYYAKDEEKDLKERCEIFSRYLKNQRDRAIFEIAIARKSIAVEGFETCGRQIKEILKDSLKPLPRGIKRPATYALTYPGRVSFTPGLDRMIEDFSLHSGVKATAVGGYTFGDTMRLGIVCRFDDPAFSEGILKAFTQAGIEAELTDRGYVESPDVLSIDSLRQV
ncbi:MAG: hypothetical protein K5886_12460 [Lachnospiraceae bacterium]|nr:hypothetical protein [Lachnospiraceae bacterium]